MGHDITRAKEIITMIGKLNDELDSIIHRIRVADLQKAVRQMRGVCEEVDKDNKGN